MRLVILLAVAVLGLAGTAQTKSPPTPEDLQLDKAEALVTHSIRSIRRSFALPSPTPPSPFQ